MSLADWCDVVYAFSWEMLERQIHTAQIITGQRIAAGDKDAKMPDLAKVREDFDLRLNAPPRPRKAVGGGEAQRRGVQVGDS